MSYNSIIDSVNLFEQIEPSDVWVIELKSDNTTPIAECYTSNQKERIFPIEVKQSVQKQVTIRFSEPRNGYAYII